MSTAATPRPRAALYRMAMPGHLCPFGLKAKWQLERRGYAVEDHPLRSRAEVDAVKAEFGVSTTPQAFVGGERVGGYSDLRRFFGAAAPDPKAPSYRPVIALFATALVLALAAAWSVTGQPASLLALRWFAGFATGLLALQKLRDVEGFSTMFLNYDVLARRWVPYAYAYPWLEALAAVLMVAGALRPIGAPVSLLIGGVGAWSVFRAVYVERRELKCACVGGDSRVPLGFVSLTENLVMVAMGVWMAAGWGMGA